ncbi:MAG: ABC transporter permease [Thermoplasmata archaeon]|nr:ABC transporter permease [Thermoplasmata archaeon]
MGNFENDAMDDAHNIWLTVKFEMRKHFRRRRFIMAVGISLFIALIFSFLPFMVGGDFPDTGIAFFNNNLGFVGMLIVIVAAIFAGDVISSEFEKKTGLLLFPTPQRRGTILVGKFIAALIPVLLSVGLYYLITSISVVIIYGFADLPIEALYSFLIALLYSTSIVSVIYFFSSFMKRSITSSLVGFFLIMMIFPIISMIMNAAGVEPWFILTYSGDLITNVLDVTTENFRPGGGMREELSEPDMLLGLIMMAGYALAGSVGGFVLAMRRRME